MLVLQASECERIVLTLPDGQRIVVVLAENSRPYKPRLGFIAPNSVRITREPVDDSR